MRLGILTGGGRLPRPERAIRRWSVAASARTAWSSWAPRRLARRPRRRQPAARIADTTGILPRGGSSVLRGRPVSRRERPQGASWRRSRSMSSTVSCADRRRGDARRRGPARRRGRPDRGRPEDDRQRSRGDRRDGGVPHGRPGRDRRDRPAALDRGEPRPGHARRGDGPAIRLDRGVCGDGGGADAILDPRAPFDIDGVCRHLRHRHASRSSFRSSWWRKEPSRWKGRSISRSLPSMRTDSRGSGASNHLAPEIEGRTGFQTRVTILGHVQRGGSPVSFDACWLPDSASPPRISRPPGMGPDGRAEVPGGPRRADRRRRGDGAQRGSAELHREAEVFG